MAQNKQSLFDFDSIADKYDSWYENPEGAMYDRLEKKTLCRYLPRNPRAMKLLEVGCGTGHWSRLFSERGFKVTGVDDSERMIEIARRKNIPNASFLKADAHSLPFADDSFDVTAAIATLEFVRNPEKVVREMVRCTRKATGELLIGTLNALARLNRNRQQDPRSPYAKARLFSPEQLKELLEPYGSVRMITAGFVPMQRFFLPLSPLLDAAGRLLHSPRGSFIVAQVKL